MYFYRQDVVRCGVCNNADRHNLMCYGSTLAVWWWGEEFIRWQLTGEDARADGRPDRQLAIPPHLRHYCEAWASGSMPCFVFANWLEETVPGQVPDVILALLREPCENHAPVGVAKWAV